MAKMGNWMQSFPMKVSIWLLLSCLDVVSPSSQSLLIDAIYQFGDSISDAGNLMRENSSSLCTTFPYGESYFHFATGRCSDGLIMADYYARAFGLEFLNPYLDKGANFNNGINFAVGGATALDVSFLESKHLKVTITNSSLSVQLEWFRKHLKSICTSSLTECKSKLGKSLFLMEAIGGNDYDYVFTDSFSYQVAYDLVPDVVHSILDAVREMIRLGGVNVLVPALFPLGCIPYYLTMIPSTSPDMYDDLGCLVELNSLAEYHNQHLQEGVKGLQTIYPNANLMYADYYLAITSLLRNSSSLGFQQGDNLKICCGYGKNPYNFNSSELCGSLGVPVCPDPEKRVVWDGFHFTQHYYMYLSNWMLEHTIIPGLITNPTLSSL